MSLPKNSLPAVTTIINFIGFPSIIVLTVETLTPKAAEPVLLDLAEVLRITDTGGDDAEGIANGLETMPLVPL
ncbi:MAG: hypothetical protein ACFFFG_05480 [Candidatus Thorarchaeota archaeon]